MWTRSQEPNLSGSVTSVASPGSLLAVRAIEAETWERVVWISANADAWTRVGLPDAVWATAPGDIVWGNGRFKVFGTWGRYFDWTKYELARGSYGGDTWLVYYRGLDTLDIGNLSLANMPGPDLWVVPGAARDRRVPNFDSTDPDIKPM